MQMGDTSEAAFRAWLEAKKNEVVGYRCTPSACAFAKFLVEQGAYTASVGCDRYVVTRMPLGVGGPIDSKVEHTPRWLSDFIAKFDNGGRESEVRGEEALTYLS